MDDMHDLGPGKGVGERRVEGQGEDDDLDDDDDDGEELGLDGIDPALLEAAGHALAADGYQVPDSELMRHRTEGVGEE